MKTHSLARNLRMLADWLEHLPDQDLDELEVLGPARRTNLTSLGVNVATLASLSRVNRNEWIDFIKQHSFPIQVRTRDASRDILGKLLKFLEEEPGAIAYLQQRGRSEVARSPELSRALRALLDYPG